MSTARGWQITAVLIALILGGSAMGTACIITAPRTRYQCGLIPLRVGDAPEWLFRIERDGTVTKVWPKTSP